MAEAAPASAESPSTGDGWSRPATAVLLATAMAVVALLRLAVLLRYPYPPGNDIAEQLYWSRQWLGSAFPGAPAPLVPPLYLLVYYRPLIAPFPLFTGMELLMGITPALLVPPAYLLLREARISPPFSYFGAILTACMPTWSLLLSWNGGYTIFSLVFVLLFFAGLVGAVDQPRRSRILLAGVAFGLVAASNYLSFLFVAVAFALFALVTVPARRWALRTMGQVLAVGLVVSAPLAWFYYTLVTQIYNVGGPVSSTSGFAALLLVLSGAWGPISLNVAPVALLDVGVGAVAIGASLLWFRRNALTGVLIAIVLAGIVLSLSDPQNGSRGGFYIPLAFGPATALLASETYRAYGRGTGPSPAGDVPSPATTSAAGVEAPARSTRSVAPSRWRRFVPTGRPGVAAVLLVAFVVANGAQAYSTSESSHALYSFLSPSNVAALDWLSTHTSSSAVIYTTEPVLRSWIWGYANRQAYSPDTLDSENTRHSYETTYQATVAALGQYVVGNQYLTVGTSAALVGQTPIVYVRSPSYWFPVFNFTSSATELEVNASGSITALSLDSASIASATQSTPCGECAAQSITYRWNSTAISVTQFTLVSGARVSLGWVASTGTVVSVELGLGGLPSGADLSQGSHPTGGPFASITDTFSLGGSPFSVVLAGTSGVGGPSWTQTSGPSGWLTVSYTGGPQISLSFQGLAGAGDTTPFTYEASAVLSALGVDYILVDVADTLPGFGMLMWLRCTTPDGVPGFTLTGVFTSGTYEIFVVQSSG